MSLKEKIESVKNDFLTDVDNFHTQSKDIEQIRLKYLGRNGVIADLFKNLDTASKEDRPKYGQLLNQLKNDITGKIDSYSSCQDNIDGNDIIDIALPGKNYPIGSIHILEQTLNEIKRIFNDIGFGVAYGPEIDDDYHNFGALNFPEHHPARDMQDTFFIDKDTVLRTHTSNVQIHLMEENDPPLRFIVPGRVYRNEAISYKSYCLFHQVEGLYVDENVSFGQLKGCLEYFVKKMFGENCKMRWRPSYFPFTEPSAEVDIWDDKRNQWMEILGCGMVDPEVFNNVDYDSNIWHGYAFGMGVERIAMLKYDIDDIRLFYNGDIRFLSQFR
jgi:phenylalanyl-tRNA synthetase alpha chain